MFNDCTDDGVVLFNELNTYLLYEDNILKGFIQFGISSFTFNENGKDYGNHYAIIRNMHYIKDSKNPEEMLEAAYRYFNAKAIKEINAFFHYFGMSCYARHGKLHDSSFHIEELLYKHSFKKEHENVYFSKDLREGNYCNDFEISCEYYDLEINKKKIIFLLNNEQIGYCEVSFLYGNICYLYYFEIFNKYRRQSFGTRCINNIFYFLKEKSIKKLDLDTIDTNFNAQGLYTKTGFINKGITRSYFKE
jgi:ribosomal protein S18 acetylase RimI-like enzyme